MIGGGGGGQESEGVWDFRSRVLGLKVQRFWDVESSRFKGVGREGEV